MNILNFVKDDMRVTVKESDGHIECLLSDVGRSLGFVNDRDNSLRFDRIKKHTLEAYGKCSESIPPEVVELEPNNFVNERYISESILYMLMMKAKSEKASIFQVWMAKEVLPSIRKNNFYINEDHITKEQLDELSKKLESLEWFYGLSKTKEYSINSVSEKICGDKKKLWDLFIKYGFLDKDKKIIRKQAKSKDLDENGKNVMKDIFYEVPYTSKNKIGNQEETLFRIKLSAFGIMMAKHLLDLDKGL